MIEFRLFDNKLNEELIYFVGESAQDNWDLIDASDPNDYWFHLKDHPSSHIVLKTHRIKNYEKNISKQSILHCAAECKKRSKLKDLKNISIIYTQIKNVTKADKIGSVYTKKTRIVII